ncbi:MAG: HAMP domain-containing histidine kinase [Ruminococcus sp.]|nr:HAMP domain-containing histidine kinase [Ruminococcus sp.]
MKEKRSLRSYVWMYFIIFTVFILVLIWLFQYFFLASYYQSAKIRDIRHSAETISEEFDSDDIQEITRQLAFDNGLCILVTDSDGNRVMFENNMGSFSVFNDDLDNNWGRFTFQMRNDLKKQNEEYITRTHKNEHAKNQEIFFCTTIKSKNYESPLYLYIEGSIDPIDSTVSIIREQLIYITIILFELAFIVTLFISKRLSRPIVEITKTAKKFGEGDYSVDFNTKGYREIEELSMVLDNAKDEIQKVSELRKDLIANISHDLRTPLTIVKSYAEMIRDLSGDNPEKRKEHINVIIDETDRLSNLVNNLLELSKLESGNMELEITEFSIHEKIHDVLTRYQLLVDNDGYDIKFIEDEDRIISADEAKLDQVLYNFINNAVNYCGDDKLIRIRQVNKPDVVRIEVIDHGKGISKDLLPLIFDRYYRDAKYKREVVGSGLGLSICKEILKKHNFAFGVQSEEGKGSTFWFEAKIANTQA